jgi:hypothetical protein
MKKPLLEYCRAVGKRNEALHPEVSSRQSKNDETEALAMGYCSAARTPPLLLDGFASEQHIDGVLPWAALAIGRTAVDQWD